MVQAQRVSFPLNIKQTPLFWHIFVGHGTTDAAVVVIVDTVVAVDVNIVVGVWAASGVWQKEPLKRIQYLNVE
jgi:hypothetical protein